MNSVPQPPPFRVAAFYRFARVDEPERLRARLKDLCRELDLRGTILVASEGLNGTVAGMPDAIDRLVAPGST